MRKKSLNRANKLVVVDSSDMDKENIHINKIDNANREITLHQLQKPTLSIHRKHLQKIEREIGIKRYTAPEPSTQVEIITQKH